MGRVIVSPAARQDLADIHAYIARDNPEAAKQTLRQLREAMRSFEPFPEKWHRREDLTSAPVRFRRVGSYHVLYNPGVRPIEIVRVVHVRRDLGALLEGREP